MATTSSKTIMDLFKLPPSKRLKRIPSPPKLAATSSSSATGNDPNGVASPNSAPPASADNLSSDQKSRMEFNRALARAKRNLKLCSEKCGSLGHVRLNELLVEETWAEKLAGEFEKPYAQTVLQFVESEIQNGSVPVYPPQHLIFNALNTTPFDSVKVVIIGQDPYHGPGHYVHVYLLESFCLFMYMLVISKSLC